MLHSPFELFRYCPDLGQRARLKPTVIEHKQNIIDGKSLPYFLLLKVYEIDTIIIKSKIQNYCIRNYPNL